MGEDPNEIRQEIEDTRSRMGDTVEALGHKTDVTGRVKQGTRQAAGMAQENPLGLAVGAVAVGFVAGMLVPSTRIEDERIGPVADQMKDKAREAGQEAVERGKEVAQQAAETAQEAGREQAEQMRQS